VTSKDFGLMREELKARITLKTAHVGKTASLFARTKALINKLPAYHDRPTSTNHSFRKDRQCTDIFFEFVLFFSIARFYTIDTHRKQPSLPGKTPHTYSGPFPNRSRPLAAHDDGTLRSVRASRRSF